MYRFPARGARFHHWTLGFVERNAVGIDLMLQPRRGAKTGAMIFGLDLRRIAGHWRVDSFVPQVTFAAPGKASRVFAAPDVGPSGGGRVSSTESRLDPIWLLLPLGMIGLLVLVPIGAWAKGRLRARRDLTSAVPRTH